MASLLFSAIAVSKVLFWRISIVRRNSLCVSKSKCRKVKSRANVREISHFQGSCLSLIFHCPKARRMSAAETILLLRQGSVSSECYWVANNFLMRNWNRWTRSIVVVSDHEYKFFGSLTGMFLQCSVSHWGMAALRGCDFFRYTCSSLNSRLRLWDEIASYKYFFSNVL